MITLPCATPCKLAAMLTMDGLLRRPTVGGHCRRRGPRTRGSHEKKTISLHAPSPSLHGSPCHRRPLASPRPESVPRRNVTLWTAQPVQYSLYVHTFSFIHWTRHVGQQDITLHMAFCLSRPQGVRFVEDNVRVRKNVTNTNPNNWDTA